jgi:hypothetical protein
MKIRAEINKIETNKQQKPYKELMKQKAGSLKKGIRLTDLWQT